MALSLVPDWAFVWYLINLVIIPPEVFFILMRPRTLEGGDLAAPFKALHLYARADPLFRDPGNATVRAIYQLSVLDCALVAFVTALFRAARADALFAVVVLFREACVVMKTAVYLVYAWPFVVPRWRVPVTAMNATWVAVPLLLIRAIALRIATVIDTTDVDVFPTLK